MFKIPEIKLLYLGSIETPAKNPCTHLNGRYFAASSTKVKSINIPKAPNAEITWFLVNEETKTPTEIKEAPNNNMPITHPKTKPRWTDVKKETTKTYKKSNSIAKQYILTAAAYLPMTTEKLVIGDENNKTSVLNLYSSLRIPMVSTGIEKIMVKNNELKKPLTSAIPVWIILKKNKIPEIAENMLKKTYPTGFKK